MGLIKNALGKIVEKDNEKWLKEFEDDDYKMEEFENGKINFFDYYENGLGIDDEEGCKGDVNRSFYHAAIIPEEYKDEFLDYLKEDPKFMKLINKSSNSNSSGDNEQIKKIKSRIDERREEDGVESVVKYVCGRLNKEQRDLIRSYLTEEETELGKEYFKHKKEIIEVIEEKSHSDFIEYLKKWYVKTNFKVKDGLLYNLCFIEDKIDEDEYDEIKELKADSNSERDEEEKENEGKTNTSDISDIKAKIEKLKMLKDEGLLTEEEFQKKKAALIDLI